jgi:hypothetical protein
MSFALKGGYNAFYRNIINVSLKKTTIWNRGAVMINGVRCNIDSSRDNAIEIIKYNDMNTLLVNNAIIYENKRLFTYDIDLKMNISSCDFSKKNIYSYIDFNVVNYNDLEHIFSRRSLN